MKISQNKREASVKTVQYLHPRRNQIYCHNKLIQKTISFFPENWPKNLSTEKPKKKHFFFSNFFLLNGGHTKTKKSSHRLKRPKKKNSDSKLNKTDSIPHSFWFIVWASCGLLTSPKKVSSKVLHFWNIQSLLVCVSSQFTFMYSLLDLVFFLVNMYRNVYIQMCPIFHEKIPVIRAFLV